MIPGSAELHSARTGKHARVTLITEDRPSTTRRSQEWRLVLLVLLAISGFSAEVRLELPEHLVPGVAMQGALIIDDGTATSINLPQVPGLEWQVVDRQSMQIIQSGGTVRRSSSRAVVLRAATVGDLAIPAIAVTLDDGSTINTAATTLPVHAPDARLTGEALAECRFVPATIIPGETTMLEFRFWLRMERPDGAPPPSIQPPDELLAVGPREDVISTTSDAQGRTWTLFTWRWPLTAAAPGTHRTAGQQEYAVMEGGGFFAQRSTRRVAVKPATLTVAPLPEVGRPDDFNGLIGPATVAARLGTPSLRVGEGTSLEFIVHGHQVHLLRPPTLTLPGIAIHAREPEDDGTSRRFRWDLVPSRPGTVPIILPGLPYFDPTTKSYTRTAPAQVTMEVLPGHATVLAVVGRRPETLATVADAPATVLLLPLGAIAPIPGTTAQLVSGFVAAVLVLVGATHGRWRLRPSRRHRGQTLAAAARAGDAVALTKALATLAGSLTTAAQQDAAHRLITASESARFGGAALPDLSADIAVLEGIP